jgi:hypothetical protein
MPKTNVLFLCTSNSCRSQMAEGCATRECDRPGVALPRPHGHVRRAGRSLVCKLFCGAPHRQGVFRRAGEVVRRLPGRDPGRSPGVSPGESRPGPERSELQPAARGAAQRDQRRQRSAAGRLAPQLRFAGPSVTSSAGDALAWRRGLPWGIVKCGF